MDGVTEGRIVHYVIREGEHRPAIIVNAWANNSEYQKDGRVNLTVFTDWSNDMKTSTGIPLQSGDMWATSVPNDEKTKAPGTWHWIERVEPAKVTQPLVTKSTYFEPPKSE